MNPLALFRALFRRFFGPLFFALLVALIIPGCGQGAATPTLAAPTQPQCSAGNGGVQICIDGNGNVVTITVPMSTPTPTATPGAADCVKRIPEYQENVLQAWRSIVPAEPTMGGHILALVAAIKKAGFLATSGGTLAKDEIAIKTATGAFSETYDVWQGDFTAEFSAQVLYVATCTPARF